MEQCLEKKYPLAKGIGCMIPKKMMSANQIEGLIRNDLSQARCLARDDKTGFFARKVLMIEDALREKPKEKVIGFEPGLKYAYPGLPIDFAGNVDPAIRELIDLIASCRLVAMSGFCCSGHPTSVINNPYLDDSLEDPRFAAMYRLKHNFEEGLITHNKSPYLFLLLHAGTEGSHLQRMLAQISAGVFVRGIAQITITSRVDSLFMDNVKGYLRMSIRGEPGITFVKKELSHEEVAHTYSLALAGFWNKLRKLFMQITSRNIPEIDPQQFDSGPRDWDREYDLIDKRRKNGFKLPNHCYFDGKEIVEPEFPEKKTGTNGL